MARLNGLEGLGERMSDTYTAAQAARVLGVSERRVRQLVAEGVLTAASGIGEPLRVAQESAHKERQRRASQPKAEAEAKKPAPDSVSVSEVLKLAEAIADRVLTRALESADRERQRVRGASSKDRASLTR